MKPCRHFASFPGCAVCRSYERSPAFRALADRAGVTDGEACRHLGRRAREQGGAVKKKLCRVG